MAFTIEPGQTRCGEEASDGDPACINRPIAGVLTNYGYCLPDPTVANRLSVWFSGGALEAEREEDADEWKRIFSEEGLPNRGLRQFANVMAARFFLGAQLEPMDGSGKISYTLHRPIGGHGQVFVDILYTDETLSILRGHHESIFVSARVPTTRVESDEVSQQ